jgi:methanethiol S-methyltransferase
MPIFYLLYGLLAILIGGLLSIYQICFVGNLIVPKTVDLGGGISNPWAAGIINLLLVSLFGFQHSFMARPWFKAWWTRFIPEPLERSTYMLGVGTAYGILFWLWQPIPTVVWQVSGVAAACLWVLFAVGWVLVVWSSHLINPWDVWGLRQSSAPIQKIPYRPLIFQSAGPYRFSRHPIMLGLIIAFWATPVMTVGHMVFAVGMSTYALLATIWEERDLIRVFPGYLPYRNSTAMIVPIPGLYPRRDMRG